MASHRTARASAREPLREAGRSPARTDSSRGRKVERGSTESYDYSVRWSTQFLDAACQQTEHGSDKQYAACSRGLQSADRSFNHGGGECRELCIALASTSKRRARELAAIGRAAARQEAGFHDAPLSQS